VLCPSNARGQGLTGPARGAVENISAKRREAIEVLFEDFASDGLEDDVDTPTVCYLENPIGPVILGVIDRLIGAQGFDKLQFFASACCANHATCLQSRLHGKLPKTNGSMSDLA
jgi:hypothetical protein